MGLSFFFISKPKYLNWISKPMQVLHNLNWMSTYLNWTEENNVDNQMDIEQNSLDTKQWRWHFANSKNCFDYPSPIWLDLWCYDALENLVDSPPKYLATIILLMLSPYSKESFYQYHCIWHVGLAIPVANSPQLKIPTIIDTNMKVDIIVCQSDPRGPKNSSVKNLSVFVF